MAIWDCDDLGWAEPGDYGATRAYDGEDVGQDPVICGRREHEIIVDPCEWEPPPTPLFRVVQQ